MMDTAHDPLSTLLTALDAPLYEHLRARLVARFRQRSLPSPEDLADETFDRVARRLRSGEQPRDLTGYVLGVGRLVGLEAARRARRTTSLDTELAASPQPSPDPRIDTLSACLDELPASSRDLLLRYEGGTDRIAHRRALARELGIGLNALRIRVHRMREKVFARVAECYGASV